MTTEEEHTAYLTAVLYLLKKRKVDLGWLAKELDYQLISLEAIFVNNTTTVSADLARRINKEFYMTHSEMIRLGLRKLAQSTNR